MKKALVLYLPFALFVFCVAACTGPVGPQGTTGDDGEDVSAINYVLTPSGLAANGSCYGSGSIVSVGENGLAAYKTAGTIWSDVVTVSGSYFLNGVACGTVDGHATFVTVGDSGTIYYSQDGGGHWTLAASSLGNITSLNLVDVAFGNGRFVAVGTNNENSQVLISSPDGDTWTDYTPTATGRMLYSVDYENGRFIAGARDQQGGEYVYECTDGITWGTAIALNPTTSAPIVGVDYCNGFYLALDSAGTMRKSVDGSTWAAVDPVDDTQTYTGIASDGKRFVVLTQSGSVYATSDAESWSILPSLPASSGVYVIYYNGLEWAKDFAGGSFVVSRKISNIG